MEDELKVYLKNLAKYEERLTSLPWNFLRGIVYGLGFFIGSAILATALLYILSRIEGWAYLGNLATGVKEIINNKP